MVSYNKHCSSSTVKFQPSATTAATVARPMSYLEINEFKSSAKQSV